MRGILGSMVAHTIAPPLHETLSPPGEADWRRTDPESRLDHYYSLIKKVILSRQDPVTGLLPASTGVTAHGDYTHAWVRDNVYSILAAWGLALAYRRVDNDRGRTYELEQSVVKLMRGLLTAMMRQAPKVERFKQTQSPDDALHAKYSTTSGGTVVGDHEWGHLQIDATALFLLMLGQMTASGLHIVFTIDEVNFVQNLLYYIGRAYRTPDYGIWERGNKINSGSAELNASSIGMAKAALEALNGLDLFGVRGSQASVLHVLQDEIARARITLESLLPRESRSKEVDSALLTIIGFPAFAVEDAAMVDETRSRVIRLLQGRYGCKRFLRDGHQTVIEDTGRIHYEPWELRQFEQIECEWPLFFTFLLLDCLFRGDREGAEEYIKKLRGVAVTQSGLDLLPELYFVPIPAINGEKLDPGSQRRLPNANVPLVWAQSLYYLGQMIFEELLDPEELDPLGRRRRLGLERDPVVQIVLLAESESLQHELEAYGIETQTPAQIAPIEVRRAGELSAAYHQIGRNDRLGLTGRPIRRLRSLTTSKVFRIRGQLMVFLPSFLDPQQFYLTLDHHFLVSQMASELAYIRRHWRQPGQPTLTLLLTRTMSTMRQDSLLRLIAALRDGRVGDVLVKVGRLQALMHTGCLERIDYLHDFEFTDAPLAVETPRQPSLSFAFERTVPLSADQEREIERCIDDDWLQERLRRSENLYEQVELLQSLSRRHGLQFAVNLHPTDDPITIEALLEEIYATAAQGNADGGPLWSVIRRAAGLLDRVDVGLTDAVTDILVRQKQIAVGKAFTDESVITRPMPPEEIMARIRILGSEDVRARVLSQEILVYLGLLIKAEPRLFHGLLTLRAAYLILMITANLADELGCRQDEAYERLMHLSPYEVQARLRGILQDYTRTGALLHQQETLSVSRPMAAPGQRLLPEGSQTDWRRWREREGSLTRLPEAFYPRVWRLLRCCEGLVIGDKLARRNRLDSALILSEMTPGESNFALWIEHLLNKIEAPEYRQLNIEALLALATLAEKDDGFRVEDTIVLDIVIGHAVRLAWLDANPDAAAEYDEDRAAAWDHFQALSPPLCARFIGRAIAFLASDEGTGWTGLLDK